ncbi:MAG: hypothetical protein LUF87_10960 [Alistipes sp.]|nr:hypothetical protein [Alistipes sp.]
MNTPNPKNPQLNKDEYGIFIDINMVLVKNKDPEKIKHLVTEILESRKVSADQVDKLLLYSEMAMIRSGRIVNIVSLVIVPLIALSMFVLFLFSSMSLFTLLPIFLMAIFIAVNARYKTNKEKAGFAMLPEICGEYLQSQPD